MKVCKGCEETKSAADFYKKPSGKGGLTARCKECLKADDRAAWAANPEKSRALCRKWKAANLELSHTAAIAYRENNCEKIRVSDRERYAANPEKAILKNLLRRARKKGCEVRTVTAKDYRRIMSAPCYLCLIAPSTTEEHIIPLSRGGRHSIGNLLGACQPCNSRKGTKTLIEYRAYMMRVLGLAA